MLTPIARRELRDKVTDPTTDEPWKPPEWWHALSWWREIYPPPNHTVLQRTVDLLRTL